MSTGGELLVGVAIAVGLVGVLVPVLPGLALVWVAVGVWAVDLGSTAGWVTFALVTALFAVGTVVKYVVPGRRLRSAGVPWRSTALGGALGLVGFFVLPVIGLPIGFLLGVYLAELARLRDHDDAVRSTRHAAVAAGWSVAIELSAGLLMALSWLVVVLA
jgi:uncharacterized protein